MIRITLPGLIPERSTRVINLVFRKEDGTPVIPDTIKCWLYDRRTGVAINSRTDQDIKGINGGTSPGIDGKYSLRLTAPDMVVLDQDARNEAHVCLIRYTWGTDGTEHFEVVMHIANMVKVA